MGHEVSQFAPLDPDLEAENDCCWFWFELMGSCCDCSCQKPVQLEIIVRASGALLFVCAIIQVLYSCTSTQVFSLIFNFQVAVRSE